MSSSTLSTPSRPPLSGVLSQYNEVQLCEEQTELLEFLNVPHDRLPSRIPLVNAQVTLDTFVPVANTMAESVRDLYFANQDLLVFKFTRSKSHGGHVSAVDCKPDYTAAFIGHWGGKNTTLWPCIRLVGEKASRGKNPEKQERQANSYLHHLLLARPELYVAQGLLTSESGVMFLLGIGGVGIQTFSVEWHSKELHRLLYAFIYRLYDPGDFADSSYVEMVPNLNEMFVTYNVQISQDNGVENPITNLRPLYATDPFGNRTHILSNPDSDVTIDGKPLTVLKDQLCRVGTRFDEYSILTQVHSPEKVPGVVEAVFHKEIKIPKDLCPSREKHRLGLRQMGKPLTSIPTVAQMLEIVFDILEVLRYMRFERYVLHRDIGLGNVLFVEENLSSSTSPWSGGANETVESEGLPVCFINYVLGESDDPRKTSALLIDFNRAEHLESEQSPEHERIPRTGTPVFIARAVQLGRPVSPNDDMLDIPEVPRIAGRYETSHPDRMTKFPFRPRELSPVSTDDTDRQWRHELHHDTESVFWLLLYWVIGAQPENEEKEPIDSGIWTGLMGSVTSRIRLLRGGLLDGATHSVYRPLWPLLNKLARILDIDGHWIKSSDPRKDPGYTTEAFQRLLLQFILEHRTERFMLHRVESQPRCPEHQSGLLSSSSYLSRKRSLSEPTIPEGTKRLHMVENRTEDSPDGDESGNQCS